MYFVFLFCSTLSLNAEEQSSNKEVPSIEFLGEWQTDDGEWLDPLEFEYDEIESPIDTTIEMTTDNEN